jgi:hypothetical protein
MCIEDAASLLVGRYNIAEHTAYQGLQHGHLNRIFELVGILCPPQPELVMRKHKLTTMGWLQRQEKPLENVGVVENQIILRPRPLLGSLFWQSPWNLGRM